MKKLIILLNCILQYALSYQPIRDVRQGILTICDNCEFEVDQVTETCTKDFTITFEPKFDSIPSEVMIVPNNVKSFLGGPDMIFNVIDITEQTFTLNFLIDYCYANEITFLQIQWLATTDQHIHIVDKFCISPEETTLDCKINVPSLDNDNFQYFISSFSSTSYYQNVILDGYDVDNNDISFKIQFSEINQEITYLEIAVIYFEPYQFERSLLRFSKGSIIIGQQLTLESKETNHLIGVGNIDSPVIEGFGQLHYDLQLNSVSSKAEIYSPGLDELLFSQINYIAFTQLRCIDEKSQINTTTLQCDCDYGYYEIESQCLSIIKFNIQIFKECSITCQTCQEIDSKCTSCIDEEYILYDAQNYLCSCISGYFANQEMTVCSKCSDTCKTCDIDGNSCLTCHNEQQRQAVNNICECKDHYYDDGSNICQGITIYLQNKLNKACNDKCQSCSSGEACISCSSLHFVLPNCDQCEQNYSIQDRICQLIQTEGKSEDKLNDQNIQDEPNGDGGAVTNGNKTDPTKVETKIPDANEESDPTTNTTKDNTISPPDIIDKTTNGDTSNTPIKSTNSTNTEQNSGNAEDSPISSEKIIEARNDICGDGKIDGNEECDDGNQNSRDGCDNCKISLGFSCQDNICHRCQLQYCLVCADQSDCEVCQSGYFKNQENQCSKCEEGCSECEFNSISVLICSKCEVGYKMVDMQCQGCDKRQGLYQQDSNCRSQCGDGIIALEEQCDDGNRINFDGCSAKCRIEDSFRCNLNGCVKMEFPQPLLTMISYQPYNDVRIINLTFKDPINAVASPLLISKIVDFPDEAYKIEQIDEQSDQFQLQFKIQFVESCSKKLFKVQFLQREQFTNLEGQSLQVDSISLKLPDIYIASQDLQDQTFRTVDAQFKVTLIIVAFMLIGLLFGGFEMFQNFLDILQMFSFFHYMNVRYPYNVHQLFEWCQVFNLQFLTDVFSYKQMVMEQSDQKLITPGKKFAEDGLTTLFIVNIEGVVIAVLISFALYIMSKLILALLRRLAVKMMGSKIRLKLIKYVLDYVQEYERKFFYCVLIFIISTTLYESSFAMFLQLKYFHMSRQDPLLGFSCVLSAMFFVVVLIYFKWISWIMFRDRYWMKMKQSQRKYGILYENRRICMSSQRLFVVYEIFGKMVFMFFLISQYDMPIFQTLGIMLNTLTQLLMGIALKTYKDMKEYCKRLISDGLILVIELIICIFAVDDETRYFEEEQRVRIGWVINVSLLVLIVLQLLFDVYQHMMYLKENYSMIKKLIKYFQGIRKPKEIAKKTQFEKVLYLGNELIDKGRFMRMRQLFQTNANTISMAK